MLRESGSGPRPRRTSDDQADGAIISKTSAVNTGLEKHLFDGVIWALSLFRFYSCVYPRQLACAFQ